MNSTNLIYKVVIFLIILFVSSFSYYVPNFKIYKELQPVEDDNRCWSYCSWSVLNRYNKNVAKEAIESYATNNSTNTNVGRPVVSPIGTRPYSPYSVQGILYHFSNGSVDPQAQGSPPLYNFMKTMLNSYNGTPIPVRWKWYNPDPANTDDDGHVLVICGYDDSKQEVIYYDPRFGIKSKPYSWFCDNTKSGEAELHLWNESLWPIKKLSAILASCPARLGKIIVTEASRCGTGGMLCDDNCADMDNAIKRIYTNDYSFLNPLMSAFAAEFETKADLGPTNTANRPSGVFVGNAQSRLYEYTIQAGDVPTEGNYELQITYILGSIGYTLKRLYELQGEYFNAEVYVDDIYYGPALSADYTNISTPVSDALISNPSTISTKFYLTPTAKKLSILITSGQLNTFNINSNRAVVVIKNFDFSPAANANPISTDYDPFGTSDNHNTSNVSGSNANGSSVFINGSTVTLPTVGSGKNPIFSNDIYRAPCNKCALRRDGKDEFLRLIVDWGDGSSSDWVKYDYIPFVHTYKNNGTYTIKGYYAEQTRFLWFSGWKERWPCTTPYSVIINPPPKTDDPASISIPRRTVTLTEQNKRFFPETSNLRFKTLANCTATPPGTISPVSKTATGNIKIDWGDGIISPATVHLAAFPTTWNKYVHMYSGAAKYDIKIFYETKDIINVTSASAKTTVTCYNYEQITTNAIEMAEISASSVTGLTPLKMVKIPGKNLLMSSTEITQGEYHSVTDRIPSRYTYFGTATQNYPADDMTYYDAVVYCNNRSLIDGLKPVYKYDSPMEIDYKDKILNGDHENLSILRNLSANLNNNGYSLPTKEEWEYAYLAGTSPTANSGYYWTTGNATDYAWYSANSTDKSNPVAQKKSNNWGLYDMAGNIAEWTMNEPTSQNGNMGCNIGDAECRNGGSFSGNISEISFHSNACASKSGNSRLLGFRIVRKAPDITPILNLLLGD